MSIEAAGRPTHRDPLFILAMDHRASFGKTLFGVTDDRPDETQRAAMTGAKQLIFEGLQQASRALTGGRAGVLVDEQYGRPVIDRVVADRGAAPGGAAGQTAGIALAVPVEASGHDWFTLQWGDDWLEHVRRIGPDYAKVLVRDNPDFDAGRRRDQLAALARVSGELDQAGVPLLYELLVPATDAQLAGVGGTAEDYDRRLRPELVSRVIADNQAEGIAPALWKVEGLETVEAARQVAEQVKAGDRTADLIVLGRDAPPDRLNHWLEIAAQVEAFVGFAIGRSIWEDVVRDFEASDRGEQAAADARTRVADRYLGFAAHWRP